jgi:serine/threonine-protein kinase RsbW
MQQRQGFRFNLPSNSESMRRVQDDVAHLLEELDFSERDCFSVRLALEEALANAVKHGNDRDEAKRFKVRCQADCEHIEIEVCDEGKGFTHEQVSSPTDGDRLFNANGRGLALMQRFMDLVEFRANGSSILMQKRRTAVEA